MNPLASRECIRAYEQFRDEGVLDGEPLPPANGSDATDWKEATEAAEAWCKITDEEGRNHAIYCFRAGYLKAKRTADHGDKSSPASWSKTPPTGPGYFWSRSHGGEPVIAWYTDTGIRMSCDQTVIVLDSDEGRDWISTQEIEFWPEPIEFARPPQKQLLQQQVADSFAYSTIEEFEQLVGYRVNEEFRNGWIMGRTMTSHIAELANTEVSDGGPLTKSETAADTRRSLD